MIDFPSWIFIDDSTVVKRYGLNQIRSEMDVGPQKTRPIQSVPIFNMAFQVAINMKRYNEFQEWFLNDLRGGASHFLLNDPLDGIKKRFRFVETELEWSKSGNLLRSSFTLESYDGV